MRVTLLLPIALCCAASAATASAAVMVDRPGPIAGQALIKIQATPYGYSGGGYAQPYGYSGSYSQPYGYGWGYGQQYGYRGGYAQPAMPYGYYGAYGQPNPTAGIPGSWQPSASSHPASDYYYGYR
jgi:hypothetical protein